MGWIRGRSRFGGSKFSEKALRQTGRSAGLRSKPAMHLHWDIAIPNFIAFLHDEHVTHL